MLGTFGPIALFLVVAGLSCGGASGEDKVDLEVVHRIKAEAFSNSKVMDHLFYLTDANGPRLTGSPGWESALRQRRNQLAVSNARGRTVRYARDCSAPAEKSDHHRRIRQLIAAGSLLGKMQRQLLR